MRMIGIICALAVAGMAPPQASLAAPSLVVTAPWTIAGVGLGMTPPAVAQAMKVARYTLVRGFEGRSWQGHVANEVSSLRSITIPAGSKVIEREVYQTGQEQIQVTYLAGPAGPFVSRVRYAIDYNAIDTDRFRTAVLAKYGAPSLRGQRESVYCSPGERQCAHSISLLRNQLPHLAAALVDGLSRVIDLRQGQRAEKAYYAAVRAEAERLYPKQDKPTF